MVKDNRKEKRRDECSICRKADRNPIGHLAEWCVYEGGPFFEKARIGFKKRQQQRRRKN